MFTRRNVAWFSSVALFNSHFWFRPATGPTLMDTQLGSIKHITLQLPSFDTSALLIAWFFMAMFGIASLNLMCRLASSMVGKTNIWSSFHSHEKISYFHWWKRHIKPLYFKTLLHENPDEFSLKVILISWKFNVTGRLSLPKIDLWLWINERKKTFKNISRIFSWRSSPYLDICESFVLVHHFEPFMCMWWGLFEIGLFLYLLFHNRRHFELDKADCLLKDYLLRSAGSMCSSCHGFEETTPERWNTRNLKKVFILTCATETWWENNSKEDIENTDDR